MQRPRLLRERLHRKIDPERLLVVGPPRFAAFLAEIASAAGLEADWLGSAEWAQSPAVRRLRTLSAHHIVHFYWSRRVRIEEVLFARYRRMAVAYSFIGSDVQRLSQAPVWKKARTRIGLRLAQAVTANAPWLIEELAAMGIRARLLSDAYVTRPERIHPLPPVPRVLTYLAEGREAFYGLPIVLELARTRPQVEFHVVGTRGERVANAPGNLVFHGWVDDLKVHLRNATVFLRLTEHDGLARSVLEALSECRQVIWTQEHPHCRTARTAAECALHLDEVLGRPVLNEEGGRYVWERYAKEKVVRDIVDLYEGLARKRPT